MSPRLPPRSRPRAAPRGSPRTPPPAGQPASTLGSPDATWVVPPDLGGRPLDGVVRTLAAVSWSDARRLIETGKIAIDGTQILDPTRKTRAGAEITRHPRAPSPKVARLAEIGEELVVHMDPALVVVRKPAGISTIPFGDESPAEREKTLDALVRDLLARRDKIRGRAPLGVVHRLDKATSGLLVFTRTLAAKKHLSQQFREHSVRRVYLAIVHGEIGKRTFRSRLIADRGDGLRGSLEEGERRGAGVRGRSSARPSEAPERQIGQLAVTHVEPLERLRGATLVACRLETGRTHQIRIHLSEAGHPIVGENVYVRGFAGTRIDAPRLMLHATELGFIHPQTGDEVFFEEPAPEDFQSVLERLRASG
ncbi:RluA family pseudouridine synthase [Polyangium fumosum]|uniref:RluA family pseudouridine synthase n=1 Tax=Polyangium fumosum TaxID=889272 RepID=A0A4U1JFE1_9BACT|nr:RluA family pseudouridine synthase [Polyangium fumosum]TKD09713.1 RluA family pseudouridine synthase [Polyangium fumosum]